MRQRRSLEISGLEALPCPSCGDTLERGVGREGLVWLCRNCYAGAVTLPILRRVAPRPFVNGLWQAALHSGCESDLVCPACALPFLEITSGAFPQVRVCVRCYWVWIGSDVLASLAGTPTSLPRSQAQLTTDARRARRRA